MSLDTRAELEVSQTLIEALRRFPTARVLEHCGTHFSISPFDFYAACPQCGVRIKARSCTGITELEDVFDAVFEWMLRPHAAELVRRRQEAIAQDNDG
jgi:hypothetical protein